jgi:aminocarboxymuconate-semialdehyde decarboxylase
MISSSQLITTIKNLTRRVNPHSYKADIKYRAIDGGIMNRRGFIKGAVTAGCSLCASRSAWAQKTPRRRTEINGTHIRTIDIHCHCTIADVAPLVENTALAARVNSTLKSAYNSPSLEARLTHMDATGIDVEVMSINPWWYDTERDMARRIIDLQNEKLMQMCQKAPDRLYAFASVALQFPELAATQLEIGMKEFGLRGAAIGCLVGEDELSSPKFHPFWAKAQELDAVIFMHPQNSDVATGIKKRVQGQGALYNVIGNPLETTIALSHMIMEGTFDAFPRLKICAAHGGGYLPSYAGRLDAGCRVLPEGCKSKGPERKPSDYLKNIYFDSLVFTPEALRHLIAETGAGQIMIGTDFGFPWVEDPVGHILSTPDLSDHDKIAILGGTAQRLLNI